jgi:hypothetical protein
MTRSHRLQYVTKAGTHTDYTMHIPACLDPDYWERHQLSLVDIHSIVEHIPSWYVWCLSVVYNRFCTWSTVQVAYSTPYRLIVNNKSMALQNILKQVKYDVAHRVVDRLDQTSRTLFNHLPPLPKYYVPQETFDRLLCNIVPNLEPECFQPVLRTIPYCESFMSRLWVPVHLDGDKLCLHALVTAENTVNQNSALAHQPLAGRYQNVRTTLSDEVIWVECR